MSRMKKTFLSLAVLSFCLAGCAGGGGDDDSESGFFWDGFFNGGLQWRCRDAGNGQFAANWMCADQIVNDKKWPTKDVPLETNIWFKGASIKKVCEESIARYTSSKKGTYIWKVQDTISVPGTKITPDYTMHWNQSDHAAWSILYHFDDNNWAVFVIRADNRYDFAAAQCKAYLKDNGVFKGYVSI